MNWQDIPLSIRERVWGGEGCANAEPAARTEVDREARRKLRQGAVRAGAWPLQERSTDERLAVRGDLTPDAIQAGAARIAPRWW